MGIDLRSWSRAAGVLALSALALGAACPAARAADTGLARADMRMQHRQEKLRAALERGARRLEIGPAQRAAWQDYAAARVALGEHRHDRRAAGADAAARVRMRAAGAAERARKLAVLADATARLEAVLAPEQQRTLARMTRARLRARWRHRESAWAADGRIPERQDS